MKEIDIVKRASHINNECLIVLAGNSKVGSEKDSKDSKIQTITNELTSTHLQGNLSKWTVKRILKKYGIRNYARKRKPFVSFRSTNMGAFKYHEIPYEKPWEIVFYKNIGKSYREIAVIVGCSKSAAFTVCKKFSL